MICFHESTAAGRDAAIDPILRIGGASGYWGESALAIPQLLTSPGLHFVVFDYLAEITLSIMARARAADPARGYATDFVSTVLARHLATIHRRGLRILSNAGGVNPEACGAAVRRLVREAGLDLKVAVVSGDDLLDRVDSLAAQAPSEMYSGAPFPPAASVASINAYLGAAPVAAALDAGADIVVTGRVVDSALTLAACMHVFRWPADDHDRLAAGSIAGHLLECSTQATGGNFTDWEAVFPGPELIGCPIAEIEPDGTFVCTKPDGSGGLVSVGSVSEQLLYEIEDPQAYALPDVVCDFTALRVEQVGPDRVRVAGARGAPAPDTLKVCATWADGYRGGQVLFFYGFDADRKARAFAEAVRRRVARALDAQGIAPLTEFAVEVLGDESQYGARRAVEGSREVALKIAGRHREAAGVTALLREIVGCALAAPPGLAMFTAGGRPAPSPVVRLFSFLLERSAVPVTVALDGEPVTGIAPAAAREPSKPLVRPAAPLVPDEGGPLLDVPLVSLAWARSGDKGNRANIGIIARRPEYLPWIWRSLTERRIAEAFDHFLEGPVERFLLPGLHALNVVLHEVLGGGGVASLRNDPQGKGYAQLLLDLPVAVPASVAREVR